MFVQQVVLHSKNLNVRYYGHIFQPNSFMLVMFIGTINFCYVKYHSRDLDRGWGSQGQVQSKNCWLYFLAHFSTEWDEMWQGKEAIRLEHPDTTFERDLYVNCNQGKCSIDHIEIELPLIWSFMNCRFKLGVMIHTTELNILIVVYMTLILMKGHKDARK